METLRPTALSSAARLITTPAAPRTARFGLPISSQCRRCLQTSSTRSATPLAHPPTPGPPPEPPAPAASEALERVARKKKQAELLKQAREIRSGPTHSKKVLQKRFWRDVAVKETPEGLQVFLDSRPVRTPSKQILTLPSSKHQMAMAIALEWDQLVSAQQALKSDYIPMTSLAVRALDIEKADVEGDQRIRQDIVRLAMRYLSTDTLLCWAPEKNLHDAIPESDKSVSLRQLQIQAAQPIINYLTTYVWPVEIKPVLEEHSIMPVPQAATTQEVIRGWVSGLPAFELAGLERAILASKSLLVAARLVVEWGQAFSHLRRTTAEGDRFGIEDAAAASSVEVQWQTRQWGEVEDTHDVQREDMLRQLGGVVVLVSGDGA